MKKMKKVIAAAAATFLFVSLFAGCGKSSEVKTIKIGIINPKSGPLSGFGEGTPWTEDLVVNYVNKELGGIAIDGKKLPIELIVYDSESDTTRATQLAEKLITDDKVHLVVVRHTPETVNPVSGVCERYGMPCVSVDAPVDAWLAEGPYAWVFHTHWKLSDFYKEYRALWVKAGFPPSPNTKIGILFANDADGTSFINGFVPNITADGYTLVDPGQYPPDTADFSQIINQFKKAGVNILAGTNTSPLFATFWRQSKQMGFAPEFVTMGKAYLLRSDAEQIDAGSGIMDGLAGEVWWSPHHPFTSSLTKLRPAQLADLYLKETGREITQPMGCKYASLEIAVDALIRAGSLDRAKIRDAIAKTDIVSMYGPIKYNAEHYSTISLTGGQWVLENGKLKLNIVDNSLLPSVPLTGELAKLK